MAKIIGNTTATPNPRPDWHQSDETKADYIKNKPEILTEEDVRNIIAQSDGSEKDDMSVIVTLVLSGANYELHPSATSQEIYQAKIDGKDIRLEYGVYTYTLCSASYGDEAIFFTIISPDNDGGESINLVIINGENVTTRQVPIGGESECECKDDVVTVEVYDDESVLPSGTAASMTYTEIKKLVEADPDVVVQAVYRNNRYYLSSINEEEESVVFVISNIVYQQTNVTEVYVYDDFADVATTNNLSWAGEYFDGSVQNYRTNDLVLYNGVLYVCNSSTSLPPGTPIVWKAVADLSNNNGSNLEIVNVSYADGAYVASKNYYEIQSLLESGKLVVATMGNGWQWFFPNFIEGNDEYVEFFRAYAGYASGSYFAKHQLLKVYGNGNATLQEI